MRLGTALAGLGLLLALAFPAAAEERITRFVSDATVERDGTLDVTETISFHVERDKIRRGIVRDFPTVYDDPNGGSFVVGFKVLSVELDGVAEPWTTERLDNGVRIRIGDADRLVEYGERTYVIRYRTTRQIGFFADYDELYWNATGTGWTFPIDVAEARITLPEAVPFTRTAFYTGPQGARGKDAEIVSQEPGRIVFRTTAPLPRQAGLTVAAAWPKGLVTPPGTAMRTAWWIGDNLGAIVAVVMTLLGLGYFVVAWNRVGRDPPRGTLVPLFSPPLGLTAAATRYLDRMDFDDRTFTAAILDLAVHKRLRLSDEASTVTLSRLSATPSLAWPEDSCFSALFARGVAVPLKQEHHAILSAAKTALNRGLSTAYAGTVFKWNAGWLSVGVLVTVAAYAATILALILTQPGDRGILISVGLAFSSVAGAVIGIALYHGRGGGSFFARIAVWIFMGIFALGFGGSGVGAVLSSVRTPLDALVLVLPFVLMPALISSFSWMRSPTPEGQTIRDGIKGFRHYLGIAEEHRLDVLHPPEKTPELFERYLPYAVALDVENAWAAKFAGVLAAAGVSAAVADWYVSNGNRDVGSLVGRLGSGLSQTVSSASTAPGSSSGSSSGSGGGGSSGGGGGGGGGSGW